MPSESAITQMMEIFTEVIDLGGVEERTAVVPNLSVTDAAPTGLTGFVIVQDDRDGDNILAKTVPGVVYANNDKVNVLFIRGTEPIAFQQGSQSTNAGLWEIVPSTSTDIFYDKGDVGIGKSVAPDASLEILNTAQAQLRLTHTEDTKFIDFTLDTNHDLTVTPSSTGQVKFQPTTDSLDFFQVLDADGGTPIISVDSVNESLGFATTITTFTEQGNTITSHSFMEREDVARRRGAVFSSITDLAATTAQNAFLKARVGPAAVADADRVGDFLWSGHDGTDFNRSARFGAIVDGTVSGNTVPLTIDFSTSETNSAGLTERMRIAAAGHVAIGCR